MKADAKGLGGGMLGREEVRRKMGCKIQERDS